MQIPVVWVIPAGESPAYRSGRRQKEASRLTDLFGSPRVAAVPFFYALCRAELPCRRGAADWRYRCGAGGAGCRGVQRFRRRCRSGGVLRRCGGSKQKAVFHWKTAFIVCRSRLFAQRRNAHVGSAFALLAELDGSVDKCEQRVILTHADVLTGVVNRAALTDDDVARPFAN